MDWLSWFFYTAMVVSTLAVHELGHWAQMRRSGVSIKRITLGMGPAVRIVGNYYLGMLPIGAAVSPDPSDWEKTSSYQRFLIAIAGPIASFCAGIVMLALASLYAAKLKGLAAFASLHFVLGMVNLIPIPPLDGWVALTALLQLRARPLSARSQHVAARLGNGLIYGLGFWYIGKLLSGEL